MTYESMEQVDLSKKGEKARRNLGSARTDIKAVNKVLGQIAEVYRSLTKLEDETKLEVETKSEVEKTRCMVDGLPSRIEFKENKNDLPFYVDFSVAPSKDSGTLEMEGVIVYGTSRSLCFTKCLFPNKAEETPHCERCDRIARCDGLEDKPLLRLTVNRHGRINPVELDDEWWIALVEKDKKKKRDDEKNQKALADLHYRAIDRIWGDALDWTNENILP